MWVWRGGVLDQLLDARESYLLWLCDMQNPADLITGQLSVSDIAEQGPNVVMWRARA